MLGMPDVWRQHHNWISQTITLCLPTQVFNRDAKTIEVGQRQVWNYRWRQIEEDIGQLW